MRISYQGSVSTKLTVVSLSRIFRSSHQAWLLLEVVVAMALFSAVVVSYVVALNQTTELSLSAKRDSQVFRLLEGALMEAATLPTLTESTYDYTLEELNMQLRIETQPIELYNVDKLLLEDMWLIRATAHWVQDGVTQEEVLETWRYGKMYQP